MSSFQSPFQLSKYPMMIHKAENRVLEIQESIAVVVDQLACHDAEIEKAIAKNESLKNEQQRKAYKLDAQREDDYVGLQTELKDLKFQLADAEIDLNLYRNQFSVAKIEARLEIAQLEQAAA